MEAHYSHTWSKGIVPIAHVAVVSSSTAASAAATSAVATSILFRVGCIGIIQQGRVSFTGVSLDRGRRRDSVIEFLLGSSELRHDRQMGRFLVFAARWGRWRSRHSWCFPRHASRETDRMFAKHESTQTLNPTTLSTPTQSLEGTRRRMDLRPL